MNFVLKKKDYIVKIKNKKALLKGFHVLLVHTSRLPSARFKRTPGTPFKRTPGTMGGGHKQLLLYGYLCDVTIIITSTPW